jgi:bifunctional diaminopimelate decarboxylase / aspartate kinase
MCHWWIERQQELKALAEEKLPLLVYNEEILNETFFDLLAVRAVEKVFQSAAAVPYPRILQKALELGAGFQCRSLAEVERLLGLFPALDPGCLLLVPPRETPEEYEQFLNFGMNLVAGTERWIVSPDMLNRRPIFQRLRIHPDTGTLEGSMTTLPREAAGIYLEVRGSHVPSVDLIRLIPALYEQAGFVPDRHILCLAGGIGLPVHPEKDTIMAQILSDCLDDIMERYAGLRIWVEPGRHLISHAAILLVGVTDSGRKGRKNGVPLSLDARLAGRCFGEQALPKVFSLTRPDQEPQMLPAIIMGDESLATLRHLDPPPFSAKVDVLVITNQGCIGPHAEGPLGSVAKRFLKARRICQVKI